MSKLQPLSPRELRRSTRQWKQWHRNWFPPYDWEVPRFIETKEVVQ